MVKQLTDKYQKLTYQAITQSQQSYLQAYGLTNHEEDIFHFINHLLHNTTNSFLDLINQDKIKVNSTIPPPPPPPPQVPHQIVQQVEQMMKNLALPLSLQRKGDHYWSQEDPKTIQVKQYIKKLRQQDKKMKQQAKKKRQAILNQKNQKYHKQIQQQSKIQDKQKQQEKQKMIKKIQMIKSQSETRKKLIQESLEFMKKRGTPMFKKIQEEFKNKIQIPTLEEKKRKLSEIRELRKSVDLVEIQQHKEKYQKIKQEHEGVKIYNQPVKVSFKGQFYKKLQGSNQYQQPYQSRVKSLYDKKKQYSEIIKTNFKPKIDQQKVEQISSRIIQMNKKFKRPKRNKKKEQQDDQDNQQQQQKQQQQQPEPEPQEEQQDQDDQDHEQSPKDDQYEPSNIERYKLGLKYLQQARKKRKIIKKQQNSQDLKNKTFSAQQAKQLQTSKIEISILPQLSKEDPSKKGRYIDYLKQMSKTNKTIDFIDTSRIKKQLTNDFKIKDKSKIQDLQNKLKTIEYHAKNQQQLLKHKKIKREEAVTKKLSLDNAILQTIKARLAIMNN